RGTEGDGHGGVRRHAGRHHPRGRAGARALRRRRAALRKGGRGGRETAARARGRRARGRAPRSGRRARVDRSILAFSALRATACSFAPEYKRPDTVTPAEYRFAQPGEAASFADLPWWQVFKDPTLQDLVRAALANNQDLALAAARVDESRAFVGIAKADL